MLMMLRICSFLCVFASLVQVSSSIQCYRFSTTDAIKIEHETVLSDVIFVAKVNIETISLPSANSNVNDTTSTLNVFDSTSDKLLHTQILNASIFVEEKSSVLYPTKTLELKLKVSSGSKKLFFSLSHPNCNLEGEPDEIKDNAFEQTAEVYSIPAWLSLFPPLLTLIVAILTRNVLLSLSLGIFLGTTFLHHYNPLLGLARMMDDILPSAVGDKSHAVVLLFCWLLSGMVGIISKSGGAGGLAQLVIKRANSSATGQLCTWGLGLLIFFDDYANSLIVGNTVRPITDRLRISREKLAFIVDGTAAPIASIAPISSWVGFELSLIKDEFQRIGLDKSAYITFLETIPLRFYPIFLIVFCFVSIMTQRDFGPMFAAENRARTTGKVENRPENCPERESALHDPPSEADAEEEVGVSNDLFVPKVGIPLRWYNALVPIICVIVLTFLGLIVDGWYTISESSDEEKDYSITKIFSSADSFRVLMWGGLVSYIIPMCMYWYQRILTPSETTHYWIEGMKELMEPVLILILAWSLGDVVNRLNLASWLAQIVGKSVPIGWLSTIIFLLSGFISFCTGSSWGTMTILFPIVIRLAWDIGEQDYDLLVQNIASVLAGSVFGDHCSPISDTTVLTCLATKCSIPDHIKTQLPYATVVSIISIGLGTIPSSFCTTSYPLWVSIPCGSILIALIIYFLGKPVELYEANVAALLVSNSDDRPQFYAHQQFEERASISSMSSKKSALVEIGSMKTISEAYKSVETPKESMENEDSKVSKLV